MQRVESSAMCMCFFLFLTSFPIQPCSMLLACLSECKIEQGMRYVNHRAFAANKKLNSIIPKRNVLNVGSGVTKGASEFLLLPNNRGIRELTCSPCIERGIAVL